MVTYTDNLNFVTYINVILIFLVKFQKIMKALNSVSVGKKYEYSHFRLRDEKYK